MATTKLVHANGTTVTVDSSTVDRKVSAGVFSKPTAKKSASSDKK